MKIGVLLSGCGFLDGAEIREAVLTYLALSKHNVEIISIAPNIDQHHVVNHLTGDEVSESRNVLVEAARIARGDIKDLATINPDDLDALLIPGGFGVAKNLSSFAFKGPEANFNPLVENFIKQIHSAKKPIGTICIAPAVINLLIPAKVTIGNDAATAAAIQKLGGEHIDCQADEIMLDEKNKIVSTPAYMLDAPLHLISRGIEKCVNKTIELAN